MRPIKHVGIWSIFLVLSVTTMLVCVKRGTNYYENVFPGPTIIKEARDTLVVVKTTGKQKSEDETYDQEVNKAVAIPLKDNYILALSHATEIPRSKTFRIMTPFGMEEAIIHFDVTDEKFWLGDTEIELIGREGDISLFKSPVPIAPFPFPFGNSDELEIGTKLFGIGFSFAYDFNVKNVATVSCLKISKKYIDAGLSEEIVEHAILVAGVLNPGDSGGPFMAKIRNNYKIVGIMAAAMQDSGMGFALKINYVKEGMAKIKARANASEL